MGGYRVWAAVGVVGWVMLGTGLTQQPDNPKASSPAQLRAATPAAAATSNDIESQKLELERERIEGDLRLREKEIELKHDELLAKEKADRSQGFSSVATVSGTVLIAFLGLLGTWIANKVQANANYRTQLDLEKQKFQGELISKMIGDIETSKRNLLFLTQSGLIADPEGKIAKLAENPETTPILPASQYTSGAFRGIPAEGVQGARDPDMNRLKNRDVPPPAYKTMQLAELIAQRPPDSVPTQVQARHEWSEKARQEIAKLELEKGVMVEGFLINARRSGKTAAYGAKDDPESKPTVLSLAIAPEDGLGKAISASVTPRILAKHPEWTLARLAELAKEKPRVRISGWLLWEQFHKPQVGRLQATMWEIHPVISIEVRKGDNWVEFSE